MASNRLLPNPVHLAWWFWTADWCLPKSISWDFYSWCFLVHGSLWPSTKTESFWACQFGHAKQSLLNPSIIRVVKRSLSNDVAVELEHAFAISRIKTAETTSLLFCTCWSPIWYRKVVSAVIDSERYMRFPNEWSRFHRLVEHVRSFLNVLIRQLLLRTGVSRIGVISSTSFGLQSLTWTYE